MLRASSIFLWLGAFVLGSGLFGQTYVQFYVVPQPGLTPANQTIPNSINNLGQIAGYYTFGSGGIPHGFVRAADGTITSFDPPGVPASAGATFAFSLNYTGAIAGYYLGGTFPFTNHGFIRDPVGNFTTFDPPGSISTIAISINPGGSITGYYNEKNLVVRGFVRDASGNITTHDVPGSISTKPVGINESGAIAGNFVSPDLSTHGFLTNNGLDTEFTPNPTGNTAVTVTALNNAGATTGYFVGTNGVAIGFVRLTDGTIVSFGAPGNTGTFPTAINGLGEITGYYGDNSGSHGFIRSPDGVITSFDVPSGPGPEVSCSGFPNPTSINVEGVITGFCSTGSPGLLSVIGWIRYP